MSDEKKLTVKLTGKEWWREGVRFECQGSGKCCTSHGEFGFVYLTPKDRKRMAETLGLTLGEFKKRYCDRTDGNWHLKERPDNPDCLFLKGKSCTVYEGRPNQCRTWPFWPEVLGAKAWSKEVAAFCPGVGKGRVWTGEEIEESLRQQVKWDSEIGK